MQHLIKASSEMNPLNVTNLGLLMWSEEAHQMMQLLDLDHEGDKTVTLTFCKNTARIFLPPNGGSE